MFVPVQRKNKALTLARALRQASMYIDRYRFRVPLGRVVPELATWGGFNNSFLHYGPQNKRLTVAFLARLVRISSWDLERNAIMSPQSIRFRFFREMDLLAARAIIYGKRLPTMRES